MAKIVTFSNGHTETYKGNRKVTAAWRTSLPCGYSFYGFSVDRAAARKTGRGYATIQCPYPDGADRETWIAQISVEIIDVA